MPPPFWGSFWLIELGVNITRTGIMEGISIVWGIAVPATIFVIAFAVTWFLYRQFSAKNN